MLLSDNTRLDYAARARCFLGLLAMETRRFDGSVVITRHFIVEIVFSAFSARPLGNEWALLFALGLQLEITARIVRSTCFLASSLILSGTIEGGAH